MPVFASCAAHAVIDTLALMMWHKVLFSRICRETFQLPHLKTLIEYYFRQCQPEPLWALLNSSVFSVSVIIVQSTAANDELA